jgi:hypothetical protein
MRPGEISEGTGPAGGGSGLPAVPASAARALGFPTVNKQWVVTAYALAFGSLLLSGRAGHRTAGKGGAVDLVYHVQRPEGARQGFRRPRRDRGSRRRDQPGARRDLDRCGSIGTSLLNTIFAGAVANYLAGHRGRGGRDNRTADRR